MAEKWIRVFIAFKDGRNAEYYVSDLERHRFETDLLAYWQNPKKGAKDGSAYDVFGVDPNTGDKNNQPRRLILAFNSVRYIG